MKMLDIGLFRRLRLLNSLFKKNNYNFIFTFLIIITVLVFYFVNYSSNYINSDGYRYYQYFTKIFITKDYVSSELIKYPCGTTLLQLPFLLISLLISKFFNINLENGFSMLFDKTVLIAGDFYCVLALIFIYKIIKTRYSDKIASYTCLTLFLGTMLISYATDYLVSFSHIYGLFVCSLFMYFVIIYEKIYDNISTKQKIILDFLLGLILGLSLLIRFSNIIIVLIYILYNVQNFNDFKARIKKIFSRKIFISIMPFLLLFLLQILLYYLATQKLIIYSYEYETFRYWTNPQIYKVLFSAAKGLFIYCPILYLGLIGMLCTDYKTFKISQISIFILLTYIIASWECWWLGYCYTERMYCDFLCIFALPIAYIYNLILSSFKKYLLLSLFVLIFIVFSILLNLIWIYAYKHGYIDPNIVSLDTLRQALKIVLQIMLFNK